MWIGTLVCTLWTLITIVCRAWVLVIDLWCTIYCLFRRLLAPNEFSESRSECIYGWTSAYREFDPKECVLRITLRIRLVPQSGVECGRHRRRAGALGAGDRTGLEQPVPAGAL
ncbi:MAG: hypothetical protein MZV49_09380 [Rhodopseudomonas palustris]|nr:hypothetical protein [Rhodopseudomonas palustris]